ncbi:MAG: nucleotidyltransferase domain-containing protein [bacterium]
MVDKKTKNKIQAIIAQECNLQGFNIVKFVFFGSRSRKENRKESDWDFIVVLEKPASWNEKMNLWLLINRRLAAIKVDVDIIFKGKSEYEKEKTDVGKIAYYADKEGISYELTPYGTVVRYPDDFYMPTIEEAENAIKLAEIVKDAVLKKIPTQPPNPERLKS